MNIALFLDCFAPTKNGVITSVLQLKQGLEQRGHHVVIVSVSTKGYPDDPSPNTLLFPQIPINFNAKQSYGIARIDKTELLAFLAQHKIELIHTHTEVFIGFAGKYAAKKLHIPRVATSHTMWEHYTNYLAVLKIPGVIPTILKWYYTGVHTIISPSVKAQTYNTRLVPQIPTCLIPNGIDYAKFTSIITTDADREALRKTYGIVQHDQVLIFVGRLGQEKRVSELLKSLAPLLIKRPEIKILFVGDGPAMETLRTIAKELDIEKSVLFTGFVSWEQVRSLYTLATLFVSASLSEVHPMTLIEAAMSGLPIIVRRDDSYLGLVESGQNGYMVDTDADIATKAEELLSNANKLVLFSQNSRHFSQQFTLTHHVDKIETLYRSVLAS